MFLSFVWFWYQVQHRIADNSWFRIHFDAVDDDIDVVEDVIDVADDNNIVVNDGNEDSDNIIKTWLYCCPYKRMSVYTVPALQ